MNLKIKRLVFGLLAFGLSGYAFAQNVLQPYLQGSDTSHNRQIFEVGMLKMPNLNNGLTALSGGAQAGTALSLGFNRFTTVAAGGDSAQFPVVSGVAVIWIVNAAASNSMNIFPQTGGTINALSANTAFSLAAGKSLLCTQAVDTSGSTGWYCNLSA